MWWWLLLIALLLLVFLLWRRRRAIPKIIHQTAPQDTTKWNKMWFKCQESWWKHFPDYEYRLWSDEDLDELVRTKYPEYYDMYRGYDKPIKRYDAARYFILNEYGGIYADMDYECHTRFDLDSGRVHMNQTPITDQNVLQNALMASPPGHPLWRKVFDALVENQHKEVSYATGPMLVEQFVSEVNVLPKEQFSTREATFATHHCTATWLVRENIP